MASLETFESILKDVVQAKRLSLSKVTRLTEVALKNMENDTQLVSLMYRTHKGLPAASKISSLYAFDALARAARSQVTKHGISGDIYTQPGNCATFLLKLEGVLDGLFQDMVASASSEAKEKTKKILDIWAKSNTFPAAVLTRLSGVLKEDKVPNNVNPAASSDHRAQSQTVVTPPSASPIMPSSIDPSMQSALLTLLAQAANTMNSDGQPSSQTAANTGIASAMPSVASASQLDANQLKLLQQLTQTAQLGTTNPSDQTPGIHPNPVPSVSLPVPARHKESHAGPLQQSLPYREEHSSSDYKDSRYSRDDAKRGRDHDDHYNDRREYRGRFRGGFRGRGRDRWDDRERYTDRNRERERSPSSKGRRSRSRSPPRSRYGGKRDVKAYSPPPRNASMSLRAAREPSPNAYDGLSNSGKDEFGRDMRPDDDDAPHSENADKDVQSPHPPASVSAVQEASTPSNHASLPREPPTHTSIESTTTDNQNTGSVGLESFDFTTFNFMAPTSWEALGKAWQVTHGYLPSTEELMAFMVSGGGITGGSTTATMPHDQWDNAAWVETPSTERGRRGGRGRGASSRGGRGGYGHGNIREAQEEWGYGGDVFAQNTDAVILGENGNHHEEESWQSQLHEGAELDGGGAESGQVGSTGRMQRVGDKWVFVRVDTSV